jgi:hypothetical protein
VDFDFGKNGETNGIDLGFLGDYLRDSATEHGIESEPALDRLFQRAVRSGELVRSGSLYYLARQTESERPH